jgi:hypothetical protein
MNALTRPTGTALFVEQDRRALMVRRVLVGTCTYAEWMNPAHRAAAIAGLWALAPNIRSEGETLLGPAPVTVYRDPITGAVVCADIQTHWIDARGNRLIFPPSTLGLLRSATTYAEWAEGPRVYVGDHEAQMAPSPLEDRQLQEVRSRNRWLRELIDPALAPSFDPIAPDAGRDDLVDFRVRAICSRDDHRVLISKQTGDASAVLVDDERIGLDEIDPMFTVQEA